MTNSSRMQFVLLLAAALAGCGLPVADIRSAAESGDLERAIRLARGELEGLQAAGRGTIVRLQADAASRTAVFEALDLVPATADDLLDTWASDDAAVDEVTRTFARARVAELEGGAFVEELRAVRAADDPLVRAYALRGLLPTGVPPSDLLAALEDPAPEVRGVAARGLVRAAELAALPPTVQQAIRSLVDGALDPGLRAQLAGLLDPAEPGDLARLAGLSAPTGRPPGGGRARPGAPGRPAGGARGRPCWTGSCRRPRWLSLSAGRRGSTELRDSYLGRIFADTPTDDPLRTGAILGLEAARTPERCGARPWPPADPPRRPPANACSTSGRNRRRVVPSCAPSRPGAAIPPRRSPRPRSSSRTAIPPPRRGSAPSRPAAASPSAAAS